MKGNKVKSTQVNQISTSNRAELNGNKLKLEELSKCEGMYLDRRTARQKRIFSKGNVEIKLRQIFRMKGKLIKENKLLIYKIIIKPIGSMEFNGRDQLYDSS